MSVYKYQSSQLISKHFSRVLLINMKHFALLVLAAVVLSVSFDSVESFCCGNITGGKCGDCTGGTPCCATQRCNIFCCDCAGRCRSGSCGRRRRSVDYFLSGIEPLTGDVSSDGHMIIKRADKDGDDKLSFEEAYDYLSTVGSPEYRVKRDLTLNDDLMALDINNDQFLSAEEIDPKH